MAKQITEVPMAGCKSKGMKSGGMVKPKKGYMGGGMVKGYKNGGAVMAGKKPKACKMS